MSVAAAVVVLALTSAAAGCGGAGGAPTKEEYVAKLDAMCEDFASREAEIGEARSAAGLAERGDRIADAFDEAIADKVRTLKAPDMIGRQASRLRALAAQQSRTLRNLAEAARAREFSRLRQLAARNAALNLEANDLARELGADACAGDDGG